MLIAGVVVACVCRKRAPEPVQELPSFAGTPPSRQTYNYGNLDAVVPPPGNLEYSNVPMSTTDSTYSDLELAPQEVSTYAKVATSEYTSLKV